MVPGAGKSQNLNRYAYVLNNPLRYTDPTGHMVACGIAGEDCGKGTAPLPPQPPPPPPPPTGPVPPPLAFAPGTPIVPWLPNPHIELPGQWAEVNAYLVLGWDFSVALLSTGGWFIVGLDTLAAPADPAGKLFGYTIANVGSALATTTLVDTLLTSGPNSYAMAVSTVTYIAGWASLFPGFPPSIPIDLAAAWGQVAYDYYTLQQIRQQNGK